MLNPFIFDIVFLSDPFFHIQRNISIAIRDTTRDIAERVILTVTFLSVSSPVCIAWSLLSEINTEVVLRMLVTIDAGSVPSLRELGVVLVLIASVSL